MLSKKTLKTEILNELQAQKTKTIEVPNKYENGLLTTTSLTNQFPTGSDAFASLAEALSNAIVSHIVANLEIDGTVTSATLPFIMPLKSSPTTVPPGTLTIAGGKIKIAVGSVTSTPGTVAGTAAGISSVAGTLSAVSSSLPILDQTTYPIIMPPEQGGVNTFLKNDGTGRLSWVYVAGAVPYTFITGEDGTDFNIFTVGSDNIFNLPIASATKTGKLSSTDWSIFNSKQPSGDYITALTGDVTATGPGSVNTTIPNNTITFAKMQDSVSGFAVIGKGTTGIGDFAEITSDTDTVLRRAGSGDLLFGTLVTNHIGDTQVTYSKIQNISATNRILGRISIGAGSVEELTSTNVKTILSLTAADIASGTFPSGTFSFTNGVIIGGDLTVNGTTTTINSTTLTVDDINIELGAVVSPTDATADGGGIILKGTTDKTILWDNTNDNWTSSDHWNIATGKTLKHDNNVILDASRNINNVVAISASGLLSLTSGSAVHAITNVVSFGSAPASGGRLRLSNADQIVARNNANTANIIMLRTSTGDEVQLAQTGTVTKTLDAFTVIGNYIAVGTNPAQSGTFRLPNNSGIEWRNAANNASAGDIYFDTGDDFVVRVGASVRISDDGVATTFAGAVISQNYYALTGSAGTSRDFAYQTGGVNRWILRTSSDAESGSDAGSNFQILSRTDAGSAKTTVITINRASGLVSLANDFSVSGSVTAGGDFIRQGSTFNYFRTNVATGQNEAGYIWQIDGVNKWYNYLTPTDETLLWYNSGTKMSLSSAGALTALTIEATQTRGYLSSGGTKDWEFGTDTDGHFKVVQQGVVTPLILNHTTGNATFTGSVTAGGTGQFSKTDGSALDLRNIANNSAGSNLLIRMQTTGGSKIILNYATSVGDLDFTQADGSTSIFKLVEATKAATFSSSITAASMLLSSATSPALRILKDVTADNRFIRFDDSNSATSTDIVFDGTHTGFFYNTGGYWLGYWNKTSQEFTNFGPVTILGTTLTIAEGTAPTTPAAGYGVIYVKSSDNKIYFKNDGGTEYDLTSTGSSGITALTSDVTATGPGSVPATIANNVVTYAKMQQASVGFTIMAKAATGAGNYAELSAGTDSILMRSGSGNLTFGTIVTNQVGAGQITYAKIQNVSATSRILGRITAGAGVIEELTAANVKTILGLTAADIGAGTFTGAFTFTSTISGSVSGNAGTVTNGVYTTGTYNDPSWITGLAGSKISGNISGNAANITAYTINQNLGTGNSPTFVATTLTGAAPIILHGMGSGTYTSTALYCDATYGLMWENARETDVSNGIPRPYRFVWRGGLADGAEYEFNSVALPNPNRSYSHFRFGQSGFLFRNSDSDAYLVTNSYYTAVPDWKYINTDFATQIILNDGSGNFIWQTAPSGTAGTAITFTTKMTLFNSGRLDLDNGLANGAGIALTVGGSGDVNLSTGGSIFFGDYNYGAGSYIRGYATNDITLYRAGSEKFRIVSTGATTTGALTVTSDTDVQGANLFLGSDLRLKNESSWLYIFNDANTAYFGNGVAAAGFWDNSLGGTVSDKLLHSATSDTREAGYNTDFNNTSGDVFNDKTGNRNLSVYNVTGGGDAYMTFHVGGDFAGYFGLGGTENDFMVGGWSFGNVRYRVIHTGNLGNITAVGTLTSGSVPASLVAPGTFAAGIYTMQKLVLNGADPALDLATNDAYASMRVIRNSKAASDGMYIGYGNANSGATRIYGAGSTSAYAYVDASGNLYRSDSTQYVLNSGNWNINSVNITAYTINQSVGTANSPSFTALTLSGGAQALNLSHGTSNRIRWNAAGVAAPAFTSYSAGVKLVLYDNISGSIAGYCIGIEGNTMWFGTGTTSDGFKWYGGTTANMSLSGAGALICRDDVTAFGTPSDLILKENVTTISDALNTILKLKGVRFDWKKDSEQHKFIGMRQDAGFIAQDVKDVVPHAVRQNGEGLYSLRDKALLPYLIEALKEEHALVTKLRQRVDILETKLNEV